MATLTEPVYTPTKAQGKIIEFKGYNARGDIADGEMRDMKNLCADEYPALYQRPQRGLWSAGPEVEYIDPRKLLVKSHFRENESSPVSQEPKLAVIDSDGTFYYDGVPYITGLSAETRMVAINTKICFFPEKKYFSLVVGDYENREGDIEATLEINDEGTAHIGPNAELNFISSTLTLPDGYASALSKFQVGDAVDIEINSSPVLLLRTTKVSYTEISGGYRFYGMVVFIKVYKNASKYTKLSRLSAWVSPTFMDYASNQSPRATMQTQAWKDAWAASQAYADMTSRFNALTSNEAYMDLYNIAAANGNNRQTLNDRKSIGMSRVTNIFKNHSYSLMSQSGSSGTTGESAGGGIVAMYKYYDADFKEWFYVTDLIFNEDDIVDLSEQGTYVANGVAPVSGIIYDINGNSITMPDNSFNDLLGNQFNDVDIPFTSISIKRSCPDLDYVMEHNNRLWGVSNKDNTIYASKLGDPTNWSYFQNTALDSYYAEQGSDGEWTGCAAYSTHLLFFKEDCIHKVYGSLPAEYQIVTATCHGVEKGSADSIVFMNDAILYKSRVGIMAYGGGSPELISTQFGNEKYKNVVAGTDGRRYYACLENVKTGEHVLMVYDTEYLEWHKHDDIEVNAFAYIDGKVVYTLDGDPYIYEMDTETPIESDQPIEWMAQLGPFDEYLEDKKIYSRLKMRYKMPTGSQFSVYVAVDDAYDDGEWTLVQEVTESTERTQELFIIPSRCDQFAIKIVGTGYCKIKSMVREFRQSTMKKENY